MTMESHSVIDKQTKRYLIAGCLRATLRNQKTGKEMQLFRDINVAIRPPRLELWTRSPDELLDTHLIPQIKATYPEGSFVFQHDGTPSPQPPTPHKPSWQRSSAGQITSGRKRFGRFSRPNSTRSITTCRAFCKIRSRPPLIPTWSRSRLATWRYGRRWRRSVLSGRARASALASVPSSPTRVTTSSEWLVKGCGLLFPVTVSSCCWIYVSQLHSWIKCWKAPGLSAHPCILSFLNRIKMEYIDLESWTVTWLHEGNMIVDDQLTHNFKRRSRTAPPKAVSYAAVQNVSRSWKWFCSKLPLTRTSRFMETWLVEVIDDSIVAVVYVFVL